MRIHNTDGKTVPHSRETIHLQVPDCGVAGNFALVKSPLGENLAGGGEHTLHKVVVELHPEQFTELAVIHNIFLVAALQVKMYKNNQQKVPRLS
jgi:hypothetical protein